MKYRIKNITDVADVQKTLFPAAINGNLATILRPGQTLDVEAKAKDELVAIYPDYIQVIGPVFDPHAAVTVNQSLGGSWTLIDLGYYYGTINIKCDSGTVSYSLSGFVSPDTAPPIDTVGVITNGEDITLFITTKPERYVYAKGVGDIQITAS